MNEFSDRPLVAGSIRGVRTFRVTEDGILTGVTMKQCSFKPGINHAECHAGGRLFFALLQSHIPPDHPIASLGCGCGYYAYFDGSNDYLIYVALEEFLAPGRIGGLTAIIEGTGLVTVGSRGFRASKAELVALVEPSALDLVKPKRRDLFWARWNGAFAVWSTALLGLGIARHSTLAVIINGLSLALFVAFAKWHWRRWTRSKKDAAGRAAAVAQVRQNYPGVPWYSSLDEALIAHPLTAPPDAEAPEAEAAS